MKRLLFALALVFGLALEAGADLLAARVTVTTSATLVCTAVPRGGSCLIRNAGATSMYLGDSTVLTTTGFELAAGAAVSLPLVGREKVYAIVAAATERADVIRSPK